MEQQLSSQFELGSLQKAYRSQGMWIGFIVFIFIMVSLSLLILLNSLDSIEYIVFLIAMALLFILVLVSVLHLDRRSVRISVYEEGFVYQQFTSRQVILWSDIGSIKRIVDGQPDYKSPGVLHTYKFFNKDGEKLLILEFEGNWQRQKRKVVEMIEQTISSILAPTALAAYQQGDDCPFGIVTLSQRGVSFRGKLLPWNEVKRFVIRFDTIRITRLGDNSLKNGLFVPLPQVDNVEVMRKLVEVAASIYHFEMK